MTKHDPERRQHVLAVIAGYVGAYGHAPTVREIRDRVGLASTSTVQHYLVQLERDGLIEGRGRAMRVVRPAPATGICARPGCGKPVAGKRVDSRWCSRSCTVIAAHLRRWLRASGNEGLAAQLGIPA